MIEETVFNRKIPKIKVYLLPSASIYLRELMKKENILGVVKFSDNERYDEIETFGGSFPVVHIAMKTFMKDAYYEVWTSEHPVNYGSCEYLQYASDGFYQFLAISMKEEGRDLREIGKSAYNLIFKTIKESKCPYISRVWNHIPNVNEYADGMERYIKFCHGRSESFQKYGNIYPAATGIGCHGDSICIYMISTTKNINTYIENPNQTPAYKYPPKYGIKPPSFSRAAYTDNCSGKGILYISGTASIIGHETVHTDDIVKQCETTIDNIRVLISNTNLNSYGIKNSYILENVDCIKEYIRNDEDFETVRDICCKAFLPDKSIAYLKADICRNDLLVEIEGIINQTVD